jgi:prepilin-type N-terminal cleavage/methylation domain-containing protein
VIARSRVSGGFTLTELLLAVSIIALLIGLLLPSLAGARNSAQLARCLSNQRQLGIAWGLYADDHRGMAMPLAEEQGFVYWWGAVVTGGPASGVDQARGFLTPYLGTGLGEGGVLECPAQPWGTYRAQPAGLTPPRPTSTYGYNGYYLCPPRTPGWSMQIGGQRWKTLADIERPESLFVFADAMLDGTPVRNCALLDPPELFSAGAWSPNSSPTTTFRHGRAPGVAAAVRADASAGAYAGRAEWLTSAAGRIGSVGMKNDPHYVPDWTRWR